MVSISGRRLSGPSSGSGSASATAGGTFKMLGSRRKMSKFRFRVMILLYLAMGCIIPYYVMKQAEEEEIWQQAALRKQQQTGPTEEEVFLRHGGGFRDRIRFFGSSSGGGGTRLVEKEGDAEVGAGTGGNGDIKMYKRKAFFQDLSETGSESLSSVVGRESLPGLIRIQPFSDSSSSSPNSFYNNGSTKELRQQQFVRQRQILQSLTETYDKHSQQAKFHRIKGTKSYETHVKKAVEAAKAWVAKMMPPEIQVFESRIPGTKLDNPGKTRRFRELMSKGLDKGRWVYEPERDYPDFGGATGWNKKKHGERDRDVAIDRAPFPEAGKYHWQPTLAKKAKTGERTGGWHATRIQPEEFCRILGPRHIVLVGDLIHWQLHDSIMYNMFDNPQACYGDLACHLGVGHPLCPLPNDVRLKFVRNDLLSAVRSRKGQRVNETKTQDPVEMPWLKDMRLKDTVILGATHQTLKDKVFQRLLTDTIIKIRKARPEALIIYRNNPVGHPECPSKANGFNANQVLRKQKQKERQMELQQLSSPQAKSSAVGAGAGPITPGHQQQQQQQRVLESKIKAPVVHASKTFGPPAKPFTKDIPIKEMLHYPLNWAHYDRQNKIAKAIVEASGGIYWNIATMTNMRPDGHVGGQDCLSYKRPGPTDEWAVSLFNLFKTIELVEQQQ
ncbi:hypothetical protein BG015_004615 [Linnemannia schmuckeri]|uniref:Uncharacterized protein n=1 Tax=Linnemannia schmuckeri TaxID=64567 RepID=A0A9P5VCF4_9FUNG|nr:hypothetical protein BG015_004615 [Linnemannia schmuckeri]